MSAEYFVTHLFLAFNVTLLPYACCVFRRRFNLTENSLEFRFIFVVYTLCLLFDAINLKGKRLLPIVISFSVYYMTVCGYVESLDRTGALYCFPVSQPWSLDARPFVDPLHCLPIQILVKA